MGTGTKLSMVRRLQTRTIINTYISGQTLLVPSFFQIIRWEYRSGRIRVILILPVLLQLSAIFAVADQTQKGTNRCISPLFTTLLVWNVYAFP